jgi:hypothetical protein
MCIMEEEEEEFESANPTTVAIKLAKERNNDRSDSSCEDIDGDEDMLARQFYNPQS